MSRGPWPHGKAVVDGKVRYLSVSSLEKASSCLRSWWYQYVGGRKPPETKAQEVGTELHAEVENYLRTGVKSLGPLAMAGLHAIPDQIEGKPPGYGLLIEWDLLHRLDKKGNTLDTAPLRAGGIPVLGYIDLCHRRGTNKGSDDILGTQDPDGTVEVIDWKTTSDFKWAKRSTELLHTIQMSGYGQWVINQLPDARHVRLSHVYFLTRGRPQARKVTCLVEPDEIRTAWEHADSVGRLIAGAAREAQADQVAYNTDACDKYGGCPHREVCSAGKDASLESYLGVTGAEAVKPGGPPRGLDAVPSLPSQGFLPVSSLLAQAQAKAAGRVGLLGGVAPQPAAAPAPDAAAVAAERARIEHEEKVARLRAKVPAGFEDECKKIREFNQGFPTLTGAYAVAHAAMGGQDVADGYELPGSGTIAYVKLDGTGDLTLANLLAELGASPPSASPLPPDAPTSSPALAAQVAETPASPAQVVTTTPSDGDAIASVAAAAKKKGPKAKKDEPAPAPDAPAPPPVAPVAHTAAEIAVGKAAAAGGIFLFVDCRPSIAHTDLYSWCEEIADRLAKGTNSIDIRIPNGESELTFARWRGAIAAMVRSHEHAPLPGGYYYIDTRGSQVREVIADALQGRCLASGGFYVRSAR